MNYRAGYQEAAETVQRFDASQRAARERERARQHRAENRAANRAFLVAQICGDYDRPHLCGSFLAMGASPRLVADALDAYDDDEQALAAVRDEKIKDALDNVDSDQLWSDALTRARNGGFVRQGER